MLIPTPPAPNAAPRWGYYNQGVTQGLSKLFDSPENKQSGEEGLIRVDRQAASSSSTPGSAAPPTQGHADPQDRFSRQAVTPQHKPQSKPGKRANDPSEVGHKLRRDLQLFRRLPSLQEKALILMEENPDTPLKVLSKKSRGHISEEGLSHLAQRDTAHWIINRRKPVLRDPAMTAAEWMERPRQHGPSRFQREFLKQQKDQEEQAQRMNDLQRAFSLLKLND